MRKILLNIAILALIFAVGCTEDEEKYPFQESAGLHVSSDGMTELDGSVTLSLSATNLKTTEVAITLDGADVTTVPLTEGAGSVTLTRAQLGLEEGVEGDGVTLTLTSNIESKPFQYYSVEIGNPWSFTPPAKTIYEDATAAQYFYYEVETVTDDISDITVTRAINDGDPVELGGTFAETDSIPVIGTDYNPLDTVKISIVATSGDQTSMVKGSVVIMPNNFVNSGSFALDHTTNSGYELVAGETVVDTFDIALFWEKEVLDSTNLDTIGFVGNQGTQFVKVDTAADAHLDFYKEGNVVDTKAAFADGTPMDTVTYVTKGEVYIYKATRGTGDDKKDYYGLLQIDEFVTSSAGIKDGIEFVYKYN